jgi:hypothetical protein
MLWPQKDIPQTAGMIDGVFISSFVPVAMKVITLIMIAFNRLARCLECNFLYMCKVI